MTMNIKPAEGLKVRDPKTKRHIPNDGSFEVREDESYWARRIMAGDVVVVENEPAVEAPADKKSSKT